MDLTPYYIDARNAITQPDRMVFISQYFRRSWMPALGPLGTAVVIYLRGACYHNRKSGETRDTVQIAQRDIALGCGCSVPTLKRELERNVALRRFVTVRQEWERDPATGRVRQVENKYKVAMDDPLTEADEVRLVKMVEERAASEKAPPTGKQIRRGLGTQGTGSTACSTAGSSSGEAPAKPEGSTAVLTACSDAVSTAVAKAKNQRSPVAHFELLRPVAHFETPPIQNELLSEKSLLKTTRKEKNEKQTLNVESELAYASKNGKAEPPPSVFIAPMEAKVTLIVEELRDWGSERRHRQLLSICEEHGLDDLSRQALHATRDRLACERQHGPVKNAGAYYQAILIKLLQDRQVFLPKAEEKVDMRAELGLPKDATQEQVQAALRASLLGTATGEEDLGEVRRLSPQSTGQGVDK
jgi:hypothetical protein